ncbi:MAG: hypothetical protein EBZ87_03970 [Microbacteriaceae bacterium]|nr:hypothetical protein [Microbacteriaceae bacterium]
MEVTNTIKLNTAVLVQFVEKFLPKSMQAALLRQFKLRGFQSCLLGHLLNQNKEPNERRENVKHVYR